MNVKQIGTVKNFLYQLNLRFKAIEYNQICNRILIFILIIWNIMLTYKVVNMQPNYNEVSRPVPIINLEPIELE